MNAIIKLIVTLSIVGAYFSTEDYLGLVGQASVVGLLFVSCLCIHLFKLAKRSRLTDLEFILLCAAAVSVAVAGLKQDWFLIASSVSLALVLISVSTLARCVEIETLFSASTISAYLILFLTWSTHFSDIVAGANPGNAARWSNRLAPFGNHPDLAGIMFSGFVILLLRRMFVARLPEKCMMIGASLASIVVVFATGSRGGLLALLASLIVIFGEMILFDRHRRWILIAAFACLALVSIAFADAIVGYLYAILELDSSTRGIDSGGSGRTELWRMGLDAILSMDYLILTGGGFRSANPEYIGFSTESSYVTITLEFGIVFSIFVVAKLVAWLRPVGNVRSAIFFVRWLVIFMAIEALFNRYLIAVGNPISLIFLLLLTAGELAVRERRGASELLCGRSLWTSQPTWIAPGAQD